MLRTSVIEPQSESLKNERLLHSVTGNGGVAGGEATLTTSAYEQSNLTSNQLQVWMGQDLLPEIPIYNLAVALNIRGKVDPVHFGRAFQTLVNSSDALRTVLKECDGIPTQKVVPIVPCELNVVDLSSLPDPHTTAKSWMHKRCQIPFQWHERLFDSALIQLSESEFIWYLNVHHMICDGWSFELIYHRMAEFYSRSLQGQLPEYVSLFSYADYVAHERSHRESARHRRAEAYWKQFFVAGGEQIHFYGKTPAKATTRVRRVSWELGAERTSRLRSMAAASRSGSEEAFLLETFTAILVGYLYCLNRQSTYTIGIPFHNRRSKEFKQTIGFFSEVLPVRLEVSDEETFVSFIGKVKTEVFKAARHGQCAVANPYFRRLYDVVLNYHTRSFSNFAGMAALPQWVHNGHGDDALTIQISDFGSVTSLSVDFDLHRDVFAEQDCQRLISHFSRVVDAYLTDPARPLALLSLTSSEEVKQILETSRPKAEALDERSIHYLIEEQAKTRPDAVAVVFNDERLSYGELNRRANQVAHHLRKRGVGPKTLVGLYVERSLEMIVGQLGILKAGAAYVPIHPDYSREWVKFILTNAGASIVLTHGQLLSRIPLDGPEAIALDPPEPAISGESVENIDSGVSGDDLAYVIYTSGSTGAPKGVEITHKNLMNFAAQAARVFGLVHEDRVLQFASAAFDTSVEEIFPCLMRGATLVLRTDAMLESAKNFLDGCADYGVTILDLPTAYWHDLVADMFADHLAVPGSVRLVIIGGEKANAERVALWQSCVRPTLKLLNTYGPTETTVTATVYDLTDYPTKRAASQEVPIGAPLPHAQTYVLDSSLAPVPTGVPGELYIGGAGVARGYVKQPVLTADKFIRNPFAEDANSRLFRTGDLVRWRDDGNLEYLGRFDRQVKIRGFRVELDGIEVVLKAHPLVQDATVTQNGDSARHQLVAYLVPKQGAMLNVTEVKNFVNKKLPEYMVPTTILALDSLPRTHGGKVDRRALPNPDKCSALAGRPIEAPETSTEIRIADLWMRLLGVDAVSRRDHFFELGGQSLFAAQLVSRVRKEWAIEIPLRVIFEAPVLAQFAERVDEALQSKEPAAEIAPISFSSRGNEAPVSQSQARIWYMHQLAPQSAAYNIAVPIRFAGQLRKETLNRSLEELIRRHESLRANFTSRGGEPVQTISPTLTLDMPEIDLGNMPEGDRLSAAKQLLSDEARRPFDLENGALIRVLLLHLSEEDHVLLLNMHHVISDQWSLGVIARELSSLYNGFCESSSLAVNGTQTQYGDFTMWQDQWLTGRRIDAQLAYWKKQLADLQPLALPTDYPRPSIQTFRGSYESLTLSAELVENLRKQAAQENATLYMLFLAAFKALLHRYSGQRDIGIGTPVANRNRLEWESVIGTFINILVLRTDFSGDLSFRRVLRRMRDTVLDAFDHGDVPFETVVKEMESGRDPSRSPLIQVLFNFQSISAEKIDLQGLSWMPFEIDQSASQFDIGVTVDPQVTRKILISYNTDLYKPETVKRMLRHYHRLLEAVAGNPNDSIATIPILSEGEKNQLLRQWNSTGSAFPQKCVHELFEEQARRTPDSIAVVFGEQQLTYAELNRRTDQIACRLRAMGVKPGVLVGLCTERSIELIAGLLGVLKAGGAYVPIDPGYPQERIQFMLEDSGLRILLTQERLLERLPDNGQLTLCLDSLASAVSSESAESYLAPPPSSLAYVIYTSGSTGKPKGVEIEHRSLANFLHSMRNNPGISETDVLLSVTTISFDIAALEIFLPLSVGARVVVTTREAAADGSRLARQIESSGATMMQATPTTWRMLVEAGWKGTKGFKVLCGGESLSLDLANSLLEGGNTVWNLYGPTETTVWSTAGQVAVNCGVISIGVPIANTQVYIVDANMQPVPVGIPGELCIGGHGVARGYLKRPELTTQRFVPNPYSGDSGERLFKTGDWARHLGDGTIECLGRIDQQLKIRGHRIEPGEIEANLMEHPDVRQVLVIGREYAPEDMRLVAYLVTHPNVACDRGELRNFLARKLPDYMVPSAFVFLEGLPVAPGGKVNRQALPLPGPDECDSPKTFVAPRDRLEFQLAQIWQSVLNVRRVSVMDNFFGLGGHSLNTVRVVAEIKRHLGVDLPITAIFSAPTVERLADVIRAEGWIPPRNCLVEVRSAGSKPPVFTIGVEYGFVSYLDAQYPVYGLSFSGMFEKEIMPVTLKEMATNYVQAIRTVQPKGPYHLIGYSSGGTIAFEMAQLLHSEGEKIGLLALLDTYGPRSRSLALFQRLRAHWRAFKKPRLQGRLRYAAFAIKKASSFASLPLRRIWWSIFHRSFFLGTPVALTASNLTWAYDFAFRNHAAEIHTGRGVLLRSREPKAGYDDDPTRGWTGMFTGGLEIHEVPGDHLTMFHEGHIRDVAECLNECLREVELNNNGAPPVCVQDIRALDSETSEPLNSLVTLSRVF
jgi:amino acid adenylation domain-containing protein